MKTETMSKLSIAMMLFDMMLLVVMDVGEFATTTLGILRAVLAICVIATGVLIHKSEIV
jgi:hypothetical protein